MGVVGKEDREIAGSQKQFGPGGLFVEGNVAVPIVGSVLGEPVQIGNEYLFAPGGDVLDVDVPTMRFKKRPSGGVVV